MSNIKFIDFIERDNLQQKDKLFICSHTSWDEYEAILQQKANSSAYPLVSTTLKQKDKSVGKEPDTSFCFNSLKQIPDLAIEVILSKEARRGNLAMSKSCFSSGSVEDLEKYQKLGVKEVWFWINHRLEIYVLVDDRYQKQNNSDNLADLNVKLLDKYISQALTGNPRILKKAFLKEIS